MSTNKAVESKICVELGNTLKSIRGSKNYLEVAERSGLSTRTIRNIESGRTAPSLYSLVSLLRALEPSRLQMINLLDALGLTPLFFGLQVDSNTDVLSGVSARQIQIFKGMSYTGYYISEATVRDDGEPSLRLDYLRVWNLEEDESGRLVSKSATAKHLYDCSVVCAPKGDTAFFTLTSLETEPMLSDVANLVLPLPARPIPRFNAGIGVITSLVKPRDARESHPRCQLIAMVGEEYLEQIGESTVEDLCKDWLKLPDVRHNYFWDVPDIWERSHGFYKALQMRLGASNAE